MICVLYDRLASPLAQGEFSNQSIRLGVPLGSTPVRGRRQGQRQVGRGKNQAEIQAWGQASLTAQGAPELDWPLDLCHVGQQWSGLYVLAVSTPRSWATRWTGPPHRWKQYSRLGVLKTWFQTSRCKFLSPTPDLLDQRLSGQHPAACV